MISVQHVSIDSDKGVGHDHLHYKNQLTHTSGVSSPLKFNTSKSVHLSFKTKITTTYKLLDIPVVTDAMYKDRLFLG